MRCPRISPLTGRISRTACRRRGPRSRDRITRRRAQITPRPRSTGPRNTTSATSKSMATPAAQPPSGKRAAGPAPRSAYQSCARTATALTVSGRSQPRPPRHREGPVESQSGERPGGSRRIAAGSPRRAWPVVPGSVTVAVAVVDGATIHRAGGDHASTRPREPVTTAGRASQHSQARQSQT